MTPLLLPVVPEVKTMVARSSGDNDDILILGVAVRKELLALIDVLLEIGDIEICVQWEHLSLLSSSLCRSIVLGIRR